MKRFVSFMLVAAMVVGLAACSGGKEQTVTYRQEANGATVDMTLKAKGDRLQEIKQESVIPLDGFTDEQKDAYKKAIDTDKSSYDKVDGITFESNVTDAQITETIIMDVSSSDNVEKFISKKLLPVTNTKAKVLSFKETKKNLEEGGWKEK